MNNKAISADVITAYLQEIVAIPSPTGYTGRISRWLTAHAEQNDIRHTVTRKGAVVYEFGPRDSTGVLLAAHVDTLGAMVKEVVDGRIRLTPVGGFPALNIVGEEVTVHTDSGDIGGCFLPENPAVHVNAELKKLVPDWENCSVRVDTVGDVTSLVSTGDYVSFDPGFKVVNGFVKSRHLDDKASAAIFLSLADDLKQRESEFRKPVYLFFNVTEETGQGIAGYAPIDDVLIVDMGVVGSGCKGDEQKVSICAKDSSGPYNYELNQLLKELARKHSLPYVVDVFPFYGSDGSALLRSGTDARVALIGQGVDASHGYERTHQTALEATARLALLFIEHSCVRN